MKFVKKITQNKRKNSGGCEEWECTLCGHVFKGSYTRVWHHLLSIPGLGVKSCTCSVEQRMEMVKLHMDCKGNTNCNSDGSSASPNTNSNKRGRDQGFSPSNNDSSINEETHFPIDSMGGGF